MDIDFKIPEKALFLLQKKARYKVLYGGRGSAKSESIARSLIAISLQPQALYDKTSLRILCAREYQTSISHSVHKLLSDIILKYELIPFFNITQNSIKSVNGSEFIFKGITNDPIQIKSLQGIDIAWVEEAEKVSAQSWDVLTPTIRMIDSEIWVSFNPQDKNDPTYKMFVSNPLPQCISQKINYSDNPFFYDTPLVEEMEYDKKYNYELYKNKWLGEVRQISEALIFNNKYEVKEFITPDENNIFENRFFFGVDWGFSQDPTAAIRCFIQDNFLYVDYEAGGVNIEMQDLKSHIFDKMPRIEDYPIYADSARPETIAYCRRLGFNISACEKGKGSVEDGITYLKGFKKIIIHPRCKNLIEEMGSYSYKVDKVTGEILPKIEDKFNHYIDALRYALNSYIKSTNRIFIL